MKLSLVAPLFILVVAVTGCGDDGGDETGDNCTGTRLTDTKVCELTCGSTTISQAQSILGQPTTSNSSVLQYNYQCTEGAAASIDLYTFGFSNGVLFNVDRTTSGDFAGGAVPSCLAACTL